jgi:hypothetical protein
MDPINVYKCLFHYPACYETLHGAYELAASYEHDNESSVSLKGGEFLTSLVTISF